MRAGEKKLSSYAVKKLIDGLDLTSIKDNLQLSIRLDVLILQNKIGHYQHRSVLSGIMGRRQLILGSNDVRRMQEIIGTQRDKLDELRLRGRQLRDTGPPPDDLAKGIPADLAGDLMGEVDSTASEQ